MAASALVALWRSATKELFCECHRNAVCKVKDRETLNASYISSRIAKIIPHFQCRVFYTYTYPTSLRTFQNVYMSRKNSKKWNRGHDEIMGRINHIRFKNCYCPHYLQNAEGRHLSFPDHGAATPPQLQPWRWIRTDHCLAAPLFVSPFFLPSLPLHFYLAHVTHTHHTPVASCESSWWLQCAET
jgi:hypothetical protein